MSDTKGAINMKKVQSFINRTIYNSPDRSEITNIILDKDEISVYKKGQIHFLTVKTIAEEMQDNKLRVIPGDDGTIVISFNVNNYKYRDYELPVLDLKPLDAYKDNLLQVCNYKFEEIFKDNRYNHYYTYRDDKIKDYASQHYEHSVKDFYCLVKPNKPQTSSIYPPYLVAKGFIYYTDYKRCGEQSALGCHLEILDFKMKKRYERYVSSWAPEIFNNVFPRCSKEMAPSMFSVEDNIDNIDIEKLLYNSSFAKNVKGIGNLLYSSIMVFDTLEEAQEMCNKVNEYYNVYRLKNAYYD